MSQDKPALFEGMASVPCAVMLDTNNPQFGWLFIPHVDGKWVSAARLEPFSQKIIQYWLNRPSSAEMKSEPVAAQEPIGTLRYSSLSGLSISISASDLAEAGMKLYARPQRCQRCAELDPQRLREFMRAMQDGEMTVSRGIELIDMWLAGNYSDDQLPPVQNTLGEDEWPMRKIEELQAKLAAAELNAWQPIETAPNDTLVVVGWINPEDREHPERHDFDYKEDGCWMKHEELYQEFCAVAPLGSRGPKETAPYTHWMAIPPIPRLESIAKERKS